MADKQLTGPHPKPRGQVARPHWTGGPNIQGEPGGAQHYGCDERKPTKANRNVIR